jgi:hypothetical protein
MISKIGTLSDQRLRLVLIIGGAAILIASLIAVVAILTTTSGQGNGCPPESACVNPGSGQALAGDQLANELRNIVEDPAATIDPQTTLELRELLGALRTIGSDDSAAAIGLVVAIVGAITGAIAAAAGVASAIAAYRRPSPEVEGGVGVESSEQT